MAKKGDSGSESGDEVELLTNLIDALRHHPAGADGVAKMIGLLAAIILTYGVTLPAARNDGALSAASRISGVIELPFSGRLMVIHATPFAC